MAPGTPGVNAPWATLNGAPAGATGSALLKAAGNPGQTLARAAFLTGATTWLSLTSDLSAALTSPDSVPVALLISLALIAAGSLVTRRQTA